MPLATGAAIACPERKVVWLEADGSGMYTLQALWTQARENLDVTTVVCANRPYAILLDEMRNVGAGSPARRPRMLTSTAGARLGGAGEGHGRRGGGDRRCRAVR